MQMSGRRQANDIRAFIVDRIALSTRIFRFPIGHYVKLGTYSLVVKCISSTPEVSGYLSIISHIASGPLAQRVRVDVCVFTSVAVD